MVDALGNVTQYIYDSYGQMISLIDARNNTTSYQYNTDGDLMQRPNPAAASRSTGMMPWGAW